MRRFVLATLMLLYAVLSAREAVAQDPRARLRRWSTTGELRPEMRTVVPESLAVDLLRPCSRRALTHLTGYWTVSDAELNQVEAELASAHARAIARVPLSRRQGVPLPRASDYYRYYAGVYRDQQRVVVLKALEQSGVDHFFSMFARRAIEPARPLPPEPWKQSILVSCDAQWNEFGAVYDMGTAQLGPIEFSGGFSGPLESPAPKAPKRNEPKAKPPA